jgi:hypothetical protein
MRVLVACEFSGRVRDAFLARGHDAWSCDIEETEVKGPHIQADVRLVLADGWDLMVAFPPCTYLCNSGSWAWRNTPEMHAAVEFVRTLWDAPVPRIAIENPVGALSTLWGRPTQYIQPYEHGHGVKKKTCLWLDNLPYLIPTNIVDGREETVSLTPGISKGDKQRYRSRTYPGIAGAMGEQWGNIALTSI